MIELPACPSTELKIDGNRARQLLVPPRQAEIEVEDKTAWAVLAGGERIRLVGSKHQMGEDLLALRAPAKKLSQAPTELSSSELTWLSQAPPGEPAATLSSLEGAFSFLQASSDGAQPGLWIPQIGAIHAVLGYWTTEGTDPATVVMPTGTGKTEAMIGLFAAHRPERLLVVVPSEALREQIAAKFELLGVLQKTGVIDLVADRPVVGRLYHGFASVANAKEFAVACNVIVTTPGALLSPSNSEISAALLGVCSHLFVDEAHHVEAKAWRAIRDGFAGKPVLQFTATPFREDGQPLAGRQVYRYPLSVAQASGYFAEIDYTSVIELLDPDRAIGEAAITRLRHDLDGGFDHVLMARARTIARAKVLHERYLEFAADLNPVIVYSRMGVKRRGEALEALLSRDSRIVVCVDMLGEGFDLPALKVAAIHDAHKSLGVTLQFVGRFARVGGEQIGRASVFVGRPELDVNHGLRRLYAEDADWNQLISDLSENRTRLEEEVGEFESGFGQSSDEVSIRALAPKMSTVVYRTQCADWDPEGILSVYPEETLLSRPLQVNLNARVAWFVVRAESAVRWGDLPTVEEVSFEFFAVYWDKVNGLLYINTSNNASYPDAIAKAVCGEDVELIKGTAVYRAMHGSSA
jgi:superfamily II DNA or RNA helicase